MTEPQGALAPVICLRDVRVRRVRRQIDALLSRFMPSGGERDELTEQLVQQVMEDE